jgi:hypothetical protein
MRMCHHDDMKYSWGFMCVFSFNSIDHLIAANCNNKIVIAEKIADVYIETGNNSHL